MCNLYSMTATVDELRRLFGPFDGDKSNLPPFDEIYPGYQAPVLRRKQDGGLDLDRTELTRYLDFCTEMLSLVGKSAALFAEHTTDGDVLDAVEGIEALTSDMARKVWQKIGIIQQQG